MAEAIFAPAFPPPSDLFPAPSLVYPLQPPRSLLEKRPSPVSETVWTAAPARTVSRLSDHRLAASVIHVCSVVALFFFFFRF